MGALAPIAIVRSGGETSGEISGFSFLRRLPPLVRFAAGSDEWVQCPTAGVS